jgi:EIX receptor 1/2
MKYQHPTSNVSASKLYTIGISISAKGADRVYDKTLSFVTSIDFSHNHLTGRIPIKLTKLRGLCFLDLSGNQLDGGIPTSISNMTQLQSLDLSSNNLSGTIPNSMVSLTYLSYLNLSYNNLSGKIPNGGQLQSFGQSNYASNINLCGAPLLNECHDDSSSLNPSLQTQHAQGEERLWIYVGLTLGFVAGFWALVGSLLTIRAWHFTYFRIVDEMYDWLYAAIVVRNARLKIFLV